ncbi:MAG: cupin domain-containing protein [SAR324 cluster bacterium]|nr:cupin domain-containing protein [SAR324 cluster bacterium]
MKKFKVGEYVNMANPTPGQIYRPEILTNEHDAKDMGGMFGVLAPHSQVPYHYHEKRESIIMAISGKATEVMNGEEFPFEEGDVIFIPAKMKHTTINRSDNEFRYLEFFTNPPVTNDFVEVKES